jgi:hypothetical protein
MSTLVAQTISNGTVSTSSANVIQGSAKAWVNFNGTGTVAIRASYNVSSITDNGTGDYTVNFTNALTDANYTFSGATSPVPGTGYTSHIANFSRTTDLIVAPTTTAYRMSTVSISTGAAIDSAYISVIIHR